MMIFGEIYGSGMVVTALFLLDILQYNPDHYECIGVHVTGGDSSPLVSKVRHHALF